MFKTLRTHKFTDVSFKHANYHGTNCTSASPTLPLASPKTHVHTFTSGFAVVISLIAKTTSAWGALTAVEVQKNNLTLACQIKVGKHVQYCQRCWIGRFALHLNKKHCTPDPSAIEWGNMVAKILSQGQVTDYISSAMDAPWLTSQPNEKKYIQTTTLR